MIDVARYIGKYWKGNVLLNYILHGYGGSSIDFLKEIHHYIENFALTSYILSDEALFHPICETIMARLETHPALISNFPVDNPFLTGGTSFLDSTIDTKLSHKKCGKHAMVLIGCRRCPIHKYVLLLTIGMRKFQSII
mmetsp:Transcript_28414/g.39087  ORF Transcript_28414/g.39087 Transcript_28414/m.39087 type:complete len:138 (+) Transcript_28414:3-416(+)